jgi:glycosyltransferase involved in cell wall biosynthesis
VTNSEVQSVAVVTSIHPDFDTRVWNHVRTLIDSGVETHFVCPWSSAESINLPGLTLHVFPRVISRVARPVLIPVRVFRQLLPLLRSVQLIHFHDLDLLPWMALLSFLKPVVYDIHENYAEEMLVRDWIPKPLRYFLKILMDIWHTVFPRLIRNLVLVTPQQAHDFDGAGLRTIVIHNYASLRLLKDVRSDYSTRPDRVIFTGGNYVENGSMLLLEIAQRLKAQSIGAELLITDWFASPKFEDEFHHEISCRGLDNIRILPPVPSQEIMQLLNQATIGISPNLRVRKQELAIPQKLFEYMAAALPIVTSDLPYQRMLIEQHDVGLLASPENPDSFVSAIERLVRDKALAESLGRNGQNTFREQYNWESQIPSLLHYYQQIVQ